MCCHVRSASPSRRRRNVRCKPTTSLLPLALLDLSKPGEKQAHDFLCRATSSSDRMWRLFDLRRHDNALLCVVRWVQSGKTAKPFSLAEVSLTETAVFWRYYATVEAARAEMERRCAAPATHQGAA